MTEILRNKFDDLVEKQLNIQTIPEQESQEIFEALNSEMRKFRREYQRKAKESNKAASKIVLTS